MEHEIEVVAARKMDAWDLTRAVCSCGRYQSGVGTETQSRRAGADHASAMYEKEARDAR